MFDDPQKELKHLQEKLLAAEEAGAWLDRELAEAHRLLGDLPAERPAPQVASRVAPQAPAQVAPQAPVRVAPQAAAARVIVDQFGMEDYEDEEDEELENELANKRSIRNLAIFALLELAGILGLVAYWALKLL